MNKSFLKIFTFSLLSFIVLFGCAALEDKPVPDPIPYDSNINTPIDNSKKSTYTGSYIVSGLTVNGLSNSELSFPYMQGYFNIKTNDITGDFEYNYGSKYYGYTTTGNFIYNNTYSPLGLTTLQDDSYTIKLSTPIVITDNGITYNITSLQKYSDKTADIKQNSVESDIITLPTLCDPQDTNGANSCSSVPNALKYIGYYRINSLKCDSNTYNGGSDFVGEMTAAPSMDGNTQIVTLPITLKIQIKNNNLENCFYGISNLQPSNNIYLKTTTYLLDTNNMSGGLTGIFTKVGLIGLTSDSNVNIRTTQIDYYPKNNDTNFSEMFFGDGSKKVEMRIEIMKQGELNKPAVKTLDNTPYF